MTQDDIIKMADAAGIPGWDDHEPLTLDMLERFSALVAAAEREACILRAVELGFISRAYVEDFAAAIRART